MSSAGDGLSEYVERIRAEWPAALAIVVLAAGHVYFAVIRGEDVTLLGLPLVAAIVVFLVAELARRVL